ncbi:MAG TPA: enoyl-CoA hydratase/isomerase family protein [Mycobacteriales bacterium]|nr:enoyl-CoA hydratase/isomerase family protein [Mycobacteriales bacterium]
MTAERWVDIAASGRVATVTLDRPSRSNAMDEEMTAALADALHDVSQREHVAAIVLTGAGGSFSAGGDFATIREMQDDRALRERILRAHRDLFWAMLHLPVPIVAGVQGPAVGAGCTIALLCDLTVMASDAFLSDPRVALGILDGAGGLVLWPLLTSLAASREHLLLGDRVPATEAHRLGLINRVVPRADVAAEARGLADRLAALPAHSALAARQLLNLHVERAAVMLDACSDAELACFDHPELTNRLDALEAKITRPTA